MILIDLFVFVVFFFGYKVWKNVRTKKYNSVHVNIIEENMDEKIDSK
jgi:hypothetical protein